MIVTLGVGSVALGLGGWISKETSVSGLDFGLSNIALARVLGLPMIFWYGLVLVLALRLRDGRDAARPAHPVRRSQP